MPRALTHLRRITEKDAQEILFGNDHCEPGSFQIRRPTHRTWIATAPGNARHIYEKMERFPRAQLEINEDSVGASAFYVDSNQGRKEYEIIRLADGRWGGASGRTAVANAPRVFREWLEQDKLDPIAQLWGGLVSLDRRVQETLRAARTDILQRRDAGEQTVDPPSESSSCTFMAIIRQGRRYTGISIGDSVAMRVKPDGSYESLAASPQPNSEITAIFGKLGYPLFQIFADQVTQGHHQAALVFEASYISYRQRLEQQRAVWLDARRGPLTQEHFQALCDTGLSEDAARTYLALSMNGERTQEGLAEVSGVSAESLEAGFRELFDTNLVARDSDRRYGFLDPLRHAEVELSEGGFKADKSLRDHRRRYANQLLSPHEPEFNPDLLTGYIFTFDFEAEEREMVVACTDGAVKSNLSMHDIAQMSRHPNSEYACKNIIGSLSNAPDNVSCTLTTTR